MRRFLPPLIFFSFASLVLTIDYEAQEPCCGNKSISLEYDFNMAECKNDQRLISACRDEYSIQVSHYFNDIAFQTDEDGKFMIVSSESGSGFIVRSPYYCVKNQAFASYAGSITEWKVFYCADKSISLRQDRRIVIIDVIDLMFLLTWAVTLLYLLSALLLAITAVIYFILPETQNVEDKCIFYLTLSFSLLCLLVASHIFPRSESTDELTDLLKIEYCVSHWYVTVFAFISVLTWSTLRAYHLWNGFRQNLRDSESKEIYLYLIVGYGIPTLSVAVNYIHVHWNSEPWSEYYAICLAHKEKALFYVVLPIIVILCIWHFFIVHLHLKLRNEQPENSPQHSNSNVKKYKFRLKLNVKLLLLIGLPFTIIMICCLLMMIFKLYQMLLLIIGVVVVSSVVGGIIFYMLVIGRKRILRSLAEKFGFTAASGWEVCSEDGLIEQNNENEK